MPVMYVLVGGLEYEGTDVLGVFPSHEQALAARTQYIDQQRQLGVDPDYVGYDYFRVCEFELGILGCLTAFSEGFV